MELFGRPDYGDGAREPLMKLVASNVRTILDIGCNRGAFGSALKGKRPVEVWGVEPDAQCAAVAAGRLDHVIIDVLRKENPLPDGYFDLITFNDSLEHMADPADALEVCKAKLAPGGRIQCCVPNVRYIENLEHLLFERDWRYEEQGVRDRTHLRFFTEKSIVRLFVEMGFRVVQIMGINENWWQPDKRWRRVLFRLFPRLTADMRCVQIVVVAELAPPSVSAAVPARATAGCAVPIEPATA